STVAAVWLIRKAYLNSGLCSITVRGLPYLLDALKSPESLRQRGQSIVTGEIRSLSYHSPLQGLDKSLVCGILLAWMYLHTHLTRRSLGASDPVLLAFFRYGQVIETFHDVGVYQPAVDTGIEKLRAGGWV
ncbi:hypothetical protein BC827DRAFT_1090105, partial [Russula dissimulans]